MSITAEIINLLPMNLVGSISRRTNKSVEENPALAQDPKASQILGAWEDFAAVESEIVNNKDQGKYFVVYTNCADGTHDYKVFVGVEVTSFAGLTEKMESMTMPSQAYVKFTSEPGIWPNVANELWSHGYPAPAKAEGEPQGWGVDYPAKFGAEAEQTHKPMIQIYHNLPYRNPPLDNPEKIIVGLCIPVKILPK